MHSHEQVNHRMRVKIIGQNQRFGHWTREISLEYVLLLKIIVVQQYGGQLIDVFVCAGLRHTQAYVRYGLEMEHVFLFCDIICLCFLAVGSIILYRMSECPVATWNYAWPTQLYRRPALGLLFPLDLHDDFSARYPIKWYEPARWQGHMPAASPANSCYPMWSQNRSIQMHPTL